MDFEFDLAGIIDQIDLILCLYLNLKCSLRSKVEHINPILTTNRFFLFYFTVLIYILK